MKLKWIFQLLPYLAFNPLRGTNGKEKLYSSLSTIFEAACCKNSFILALDLRRVRLEAGYTSINWLNLWLQLQALEINEPFVHSRLGVGRNHVQVHRGRGCERGLATSRGIEVLEQELLDLPRIGAGPHCQTEGGRVLCRERGNRKVPNPVAVAAGVELCNRIQPMDGSWTTSAGYAMLPHAKLKGTSAFA